jgi:hypothetical protein
MAAKKFIVELDDQERARLHALTSKGTAPAKAILKARILLKADQAEGGPGWLDAEIVEALDTNLPMVSRVREKLVTEGLDAVLTRKKRDPSSSCDFRWRGPSEADRIGLLRAASRSRALDHPAAGGACRRA